MGPIVGGATECLTPGANTTHRTSVDRWRSPGHRFWSGVEKTKATAY